LNSAILVSKEIALAIIKSQGQINIYAQITVGQPEGWPTDLLLISACREVYYLLNCFCRTRICLLIEAINLTIDARTSALLTPVEEILTVPIVAACGVAVVMSNA
jgi:hypothetical protein